MTPDAAVEFLALGFVTSRTVAEFRIAAARRAGATEAECAEALATWERMTAESVQRIESQPTPAVKCLCSHGKSHHWHGQGTCFVRACGCREHRPANTQRATDAPSVNEFLRSKGEIA